MLLMTNQNAPRFRGIHGVDGVKKEAAEGVGLGMMKAASAGGAQEHLVWGGVGWGGVGVQRGVGMLGLGWLEACGMLFLHASMCSPAHAVSSAAPE